MVRSNPSIRILRTRSVSTWRRLDRREEKRRESVTLNQYGWESFDPCLQLCPYRWERLRCLVNSLRHFVEHKQHMYEIEVVLSLLYLARRHSYEEARGSEVFIHPNDVVHPSVVIGKRVSVGPYCTVASSVKLGNGCNSILLVTSLETQTSGAFFGNELPGCTVIGGNNVIGHAVVGVKCQDLKYKDGDECFLCIGNDNEIREFCSIHMSSKASDKTVIGDNNLIMGSCHIAHDCKIGDRNIFANNTLLAGHVIVEPYVIDVAVKMK
ncbi:unnamed protein product [Eruca vesicaria subsp. sativa]|uniref:Uncharacterized protein n=1 Tax=Eruca vesicaria subsp. sativa TaxID=29727 RepID=A0ABC8L1X4_ERUVS|nr:unnamed protein product [Eruca vesicaria subsp. sativa]